MRVFVWFLVGLMLPGLAAAMPPDLQTKVEALAREADSLERQRRKWEGVQQALLAQQQQIEDSQKDIQQQQDALEQQRATHDQQAAQHEQALKSSKSDCNSGDDSSSEHARECNSGIKDLNQKTSDLNTEATSLEAEQAKLDAQYAKNNQTASDWNANESVAVDHLNTLYHTMNDWLDKAYDVITNGDFRDEVTLQKADAYCVNRGLPAGLLSIETVKRLTDSYRRCLKYVLTQQRKAQHDSAAGGAATPPS